MQCNANINYAVTSAKSVCIAITKRRFVFIKKCIIIAEKHHPNRPKPIYKHRKRLAQCANDCLTSRNHADSVEKLRILNFISAPVFAWRRKILDGICVTTENTWQNLRDDGFCVRFSGRRASGARPVYSLSAELALRPDFTQKPTTRRLRAYFAWESRIVEPGLKLRLHYAGPSRKVRT